MSIFEDAFSGIKAGIGAVAPWIVSALPITGPLGNAAKAAIGAVLGTKEGDPIDKIASAVNSATAEQLAQLKAADDQFQLQMAKMGFDNIEKLNELSVQNAADINATIQAEAKSEHFVQYAWRPMVGFAFALTIVLTSMTVVVAYVRAIFGSPADQPVAMSALQTIPGMLTSMSVVLGMALPILGVASWFRGKTKLVAEGPTDKPAATGL